MGNSETIRVGIGGWTYEPWRGTFFPADLPHKQELEYASRQFPSIEVNGTYYGLQKPDSFARWHAETPDDFVFALKAPRFVTSRKVLAEAGPSIEKFIASGLAELKQKLGPINWQFPPFKSFKPDDFEAFLQLLPQTVDGLPLRHAVEVRHASFAVPEFIELARAYRVAVVMADKDDVPHFEEVTAPFVYARLQRCSEQIASGYAEDELDAWAERARTWAKDGEVFLYLIDGFKLHAPVAARALLSRL